MKNKFRTKFVLTLSLIAMFIFPASNGCGGRAGNPSASDQSPSAQITVSSRQIANGNVVLNNMSDQTVSIQNTGSISLNIGQIAQANPLAPPFSIVSDACSGQAVQPSTACSFKVRFNPTSQAPFNDSFDIPSNASNENSVTVAVTGSGKALRVAINQVKTDNCGVLELIVSVVTGTNNTSVAGLAPGDFQLKENGVLQAIDTVSQPSTTVPISVAMVLDYTVSVQSYLPTIEAASISFIGLLNASAGDQASIIKFAQTYQLMQDFTIDHTDLINAINTSPSTIGRLDATHVYDALWYAIGKTAVSQNIKAIVLISDGKDESFPGDSNASVRTLDAVIAYATANHVAIYAVGLGDVEVGVMNRLANETGGQYYYITSAGELDVVYPAIRNILLGQYSVKYASSLHGSSPITLEIDVKSGADAGVGVLQTTGCP